MNRPALSLIVSIASIAGGALPATASAAAAVDRASTAAVSLAFSTYLGGTADDDGFMIATDSSGNVHVTGWTDSTDLRTVRAEQPTNAGGRDAFVASFTPAGVPIYITYLGGSGDDRGYYLRADAAGDAYVAGATASTDFPTVGAVRGSYGGGGSDGFLSILDPTGRLVTSTYLGGGSYDATNLLALDPGGGIYLAGNTSSGNFPSTPGSPQPVKAPGADAWVMRLTASGRTIVWSTFLGGSGSDKPYGMQAGGDGSVYVSCFTSSANFPRRNAAQSVYGGAMDTTVTKYTRAGAMSWSTYLGGSGSDRPNGLDVDPANHVFVAGVTSSDDLPTRNPVQAARGGADDGMIASYDGATGAVRFATYLGGASTDWFGGVVSDAAGRSYSVGGSWSTGLPTPGGFQPRKVAAGDGYLVVLSPDGRSIVYGSYLGGNATEGIAGGAQAPDGSMWLIGRTRSTNFPTVAPWQATLHGGWDAWISHFTALP